MGPPESPWHASDPPKSPLSKTLWLTLRISANNILQRIFYLKLISADLDPTFVFVVFDFVQVNHDFVLLPCAKLFLFVHGGFFSGAGVFAEKCQFSFGVSSVVDFIVNPVAARVTNSPIRLGCLK